MTQEDIGGTSDVFVAAQRFEARIRDAGARNRELAKRAYEAPLLNARLTAVAIFANLVELRKGIAGYTNESISDRLALICAFIQGVSVAENAISEAQYAKAAAILKQDYETVARLAEVRKGVSKKGATPHARHAPEWSQPFYGLLNKIAHPSNEDLVGGLLMRKFEGSLAAVSPIPQFDPGVARDFHRVHVLTLLWAAREFICLFSEMYPDALDELTPAVDLFVSASELVGSAGGQTKPRS